MFSNMTLELYQYLERLEEPTRFFVYMGIYVGLPLLLVGLLFLNNKLEKRKEGKNI